ncbi:telomerase-binding protein EST1A [Anopheles nili]|uniref:telomerase-binding protein EST1A n=1 Tax=Anopheles nili TaxID=185578 RepID=UPI00237B7EBD|nr:telomerase-binding protein EST1A [Anopheles nili]
MKNATAPPPIVAAAAAGSSRGPSSKRQQQLYSPGSGPLRKTESTASNRSLSSVQSGEPPTRRAGGSMAPVTPPETNRNHSPSAEPHQPQALWSENAPDQRAARPGGSGNRRPEDGRLSPVNSKPVHPKQESEPRTLSTHAINHHGPRDARSERMVRDTRSVEPRFMSSSKKPPIPSLSHLENLPPRLQKKTLQDLGLPPNYVELMRAEHQVMSHTLPNRSTARHVRGRVRYGGNGGGSGMGSGGYYSNATYGGRSIGGRQGGEDYSHRPRSRSSDVGTEDGYGPRRNLTSWERRVDTGPSSRNSSCERKDRPRGPPAGYSGDTGKTGSRYRQYSTDSNRGIDDMPDDESVSRRESYDWTDEQDFGGDDQTSPRWQGGVDLELTHPPPSGKSMQFAGNNRNRHRNRRTKSKRHSNSRSRNDYYDEFKMPYQPQRGSNRSRRNSQSSNVSRENSSERAYSRTGGSRRGGGTGGGHYRDTSHDRYYDGNVGSRFRRHSRDRYGNRSRDSSMDCGRDPDRYREGDAGSSWRSGSESNHAGSARTEKTDQAIAEMTKQFESSIGIQKGPGVLVIPPRGASTSADVGSGPTKFLYDPKNPSQPIAVTQSQSRLGDQPHGRESLDRDERKQDARNRRQKVSGGPAWYDPDARQARFLRQRELVYQVADADAQLQELLEDRNLFDEWERYVQVRQQLQQLLDTFLVQEMRFAQDVNLEYHFWKLLYYNIIEMLRKLLAERPDEQNKQFLQEHALDVVETGTAYFEHLLALLECEHRFSLEQFIGANAATSVKGLRYALALVSAQKIFLFLGDLARYREQITEGHNYRKAKQWYVKAQQILPKNGRPYNQLALLSVYAKRKIDAVYFYMRSLMSSNPFESARESLMDLFNETKKKFESNQRKREEKLRARRKEKEQRFDGNLRREIWIHPEGGSRVHRTGPLHPFVSGSSGDTSDEEELRGLCPIELNKRFIISFLHVLGKLITKTGMESFAQCAHQMLREFRALMQCAPIAVSTYRLLQLMSLNMFAIEMTKLKGRNRSGTPRSELQECALASGLSMFGILLERLKRLVQDATGKPGNTSKLILSEDAKAILPAIKVWCDWMMSNTETWNPPPFCTDLKIGKSNAHDPCSELAVLMNMLKGLDTNRSILSVEREEDFEAVRLQEDITLAGFTPLMYNEPVPIFVHRDRDMEEAQNVLRIQKLLYFGTDWLCNCEPPVLRQEPTGTSEGTARFVSVVQRRLEGLTDMDILLESFSDGDTDLPLVDDDVLESGSGLHERETTPAPLPTGGASSSTDSGILSGSSSNSPSSLETRKLLRRKDELERKQRMQEKHNQRLQDILSQSTIAVSIEVHPRFLVPDTNCFVDYLPEIEMIARAHQLYQLMVPIIVISELEGLSKGVRHQSPKHQSTPSSAANEIAVAECSKRALLFIKSRNPAVKCVTTKGSILKTSTFTVEDDIGELKSNDDRILETALSLCRQHTEETRAGTRYIKLDVVLLTTDRNLRVKAISNDLPVREVPDFIKWAGLSD